MSRIGPGLLFALIGAGVSIGLAAMVPTLSPLAVAVVLGIVAGNLVDLPDTTTPGLRVSASKLIRAGVVALGFRLSLTDVADLGRQGVLLVLLVVGVAFGGAIWLGRRLDLSRDMSTLIGTGYAICGLSAIAAVDGVIEADEAEVGYAMGLVTLVGTASIFVVPALAALLGFAPDVAGVWAGSAVHDVGQTIATASAIGGDALEAAVVVKLTRVALLAPVVALIAMIRRRESDGDSSGSLPRFPLFVALFLAAVAVRSVGVVPAQAVEAILVAETWLFATALFATGAQVDLRRLRNLGGRPLTLGLTLWLVVLVVTGIGAATLA